MWSVSLGKLFQKEPKGQALFKHLQKHLGFKNGTYLLANSERKELAILKLTHV